MRLLGRFSIGIIGICLLLMTGGLTAVRANQPPPQPMLLSVQANNRLQLAWFVRGMTQPLPITPPFRTLRFGHLSADSEWAYYWADNFSRTIARDAATTLYRVRVKGDDHAQLINGVFSQDVTFSADGQWIAYRIFQRDLITTDLYRIRTDGHARQNLTAEFDEAIVASLLLPILIAPDSTWIYFTSRDARNHQSIRRVPMQGGPIETMLNDPDLEAVTGFWPAETDWLMVDHGASSYWMHPDGTEFRRVLESPHKLNITVFNQMEWLPAENLLVVGEPDPLFAIFGVQPASSQAVWEIRDPRFTTFEVSSQWVALIGNSIGRVRQDGTDFQHLLSAGAGESVQFYKFTTDGEQILFKIRRQDGTLGPFELINLRDGRREIVAAFEGRTIGGAAWSPDGTWLVYSELSPTGTKFYRGDDQGEIWLADGAEWLAWLPEIDRAWSPILLGIMAGMLTIAGAVIHKLPIGSHG